MCVQSRKCSSDVNIDSVMKCCSSNCLCLVSWKTVKEILQVKKNKVGKKRMGELLFLNKQPNEENFFFPKKRLRM